jgi:hypothetical protein
MRCVALAVLLSVSGCHGCGEEPARVVSDAAAAAPAASSRAFLIRHGARLQPFGCYDGRARKLASGKSCVGLIAAAPSVEIAVGGRSVTMSVRPTIIDFDVSNQRVAGFALPVTCPEDDGACEKDLAAYGSYAIWPPRSMRVEPIVALPEGGERSPDIPQAVATQITVHLTAMGFDRTPPLWLYAKALLDLDGHGRRELLCVTLPPWMEGQQFGPEEVTSELPHPLPFLFLERPSGFERVAIPVEANAWKDTWDGRPRAAFDLDGDGRSELWLEIPYYEGRTHAVVRWAGDDWDVIDEFTDGA